MKKRFILRKDNQRIVMESLVEWLNARNLDEPLEISIRPYKRNRSREQNDYYWALLTAIANETGHTKEEIHELMRYRFLGMQSKEIAGHRIEYLPSTTKLKVGEMADYITQIEAWAASLGIALPYREDI